MFDRATNMQHSSFSTGVAMLINHASFIAGLSKKYLGFANAETIEAIATRDAAFLARALYISNFSLEGDVQIVIHMVQDEDDEFSPPSPITSDVKDILTNANVVSISCIRRQENKLAHEFAKFGHRTKWPQLVGMNGESGKAIIEHGNLVVTTVFVRPGEPITDDYCVNRVWIFVDHEDKVRIAPQIG
ncbi:hypothetical protein ACH5RR_029265 [Cinchona calisaya]|uniref:RNase H type-1 domain-containing protein n=1 Tax=Cinchona calisaya TaxID=153742 RepID=A0ABD2YR52_9GENT